MASILYNKSLLGILEQQIANAIIYVLRLIPNKPIAVDEVDADNTYTGFAPTGSSETDPVWLLQKIVKTGAITRILTANGIIEYNQTWVDRELMTYS